jgi:hypothetical protein
LEEIITVGGIQYQLSYDQPITSNQKLYAMEEIGRISGCNTCIPAQNTYLEKNVTQATSIISLAPTCPVGSKTKGSTIILDAGPTGGIAPYTVTFYKKIDTGAQVQIGQTTGVPEGGPISSPPTYVVLGSDVTGATGDGGASPVLAANKIRIITVATDSCPAGSGGPAINTELCDVSLACTTITCNANIS